MHAIPAGFPSGIPGIGDDIEGMIQHAPQALRQFMPVYFKGAMIQRIKIKSKCHENR